MREAKAVLREEVLEEVGHAQWVFVMPKMLRPYLLHHRELLDAHRQEATGASTLNL